MLLCKVRLASLDSKRGEDVLSTLLAPYVRTGATYVIHVASPLTDKWNGNPEDDFLKPAIAGTQSIFESTAKTKSVKKIVLTSSVAAVVDWSKPASGVTYTEKDWNPVTYEEAIQVGSAPVKTPAEKAALALPIYRASKALQEKFAWDFVEKNNHPFELTAINPCFNVGPTVLPGFPAASGTNALFWASITSKPPMESLGQWVDVRDVALAHVEALITPTSNGKRLMVVSSQPTNSEIIQLATKHFPSLDAPAKDETQAREGWDILDASALTRVLGIKYIPLEQSVVDFVGQVLAYKEPS
jgi:nucleoside-diphosphate-sugar epimerase